METEKYSFWEKLKLMQIELKKAKEACEDATRVFHEIKNEMEKDRYQERFQKLIAELKNGNGSH